MDYSPPYITHSPPGVSRQARSNTCPNSCELICAIQNLVEEFAALRAEQGQQRRLFNEFAAAYLNARFPHGRATDRWRQR